MSKRLPPPRPPPHAGEGERAQCHDAPTLACYRRAFALPAPQEDSMDRRQFGKFSLGAGAVAATGETQLAMGQTQTTTSSFSSQATVSSPSDALKLPAELRPVFEQDYPRFSEAEYARREKALGDVMAAAGADHLLIVSAQNVGNATRWLTSWPGTTEALTLFRPGEPRVMFVEYFNHVPLAKQLARATQVRWGEEKGIVKIAE